jgi:hypothetical protein
MRTSRWFVWPVLAFFVAAGVSAHAADTKCFPDDIELVIGVNLKQIRSSKRILREKDALDQPRAILKRAAGALPVLACVQDAGLDLVDDLTAITMAGPPAKTPTVTFVVLEGDFGALKLADRFGALAKSRPEKVKAMVAADSVTIYQMTGASKAVHYGALVNGDTLIAATTREALIDALARCNGTRKSAMPKALKTLLEAGDDKHSIRFVATGRALSRLIESASIPNADSAVAALSASDGMSAAIRLTDEIDFDVGIHVRDAETASKIAESGVNGLRSLRVLAHQHAKEEKKLQPLAEIVDTLRITSKGPIILLRGGATLSAIESLLGSWPTRTGNANATDRPR